MSFFKWEDLPTSEPAPGWKIKRVRLEKLMMGYCEIDKGAKHPIHQHSEEEIIVVLQGQVEVILGEETRVVGPGEGAYIPSNIKHGLGIVKER
jgi:quercetin dioxygenase-like cupin family protein